MSIPSGRILGFLGPNGAGKSTTIGCLTGLLEPTAGRISLLGKAFTSDPVGLKRRIGVMPEGLALFDHLYAHEFLAFNGRMFGLDETTTRLRVGQLLESLSLKSACKQPLSEFSAGMRKKVAFAAAIIHRPEILFLDEPFEGIDPGSVAMLKDWLRKFASEGGTVFMTTQVLERVERFCDDVAIIKEGKLVWHGSLRPLNNGGAIDFDGHRFPTIEAFFLHITGKQHSMIEWL